ncbi:MAG: ATP-binding protein [Solirubrobacteraceae bacterium]
MSAATPLTATVERRLFAIAGERLGEEPVLALQGPRTVGKSTLLRGLARSHGAGVLDLDDPAVRDAVLADPGAFTSGTAPIFIDEYQHAPVLLDSIKAELNRDLRPGRFVIAGSTRYDALPLAAQSLTGRVHLLTLWPLAQSEIAGAGGNLLDALLSDPQGVRRGETSSTSRQEYIERALAGGMPIPLSRASLASRSRWFDDYVKLVIERDVRELSTLRRREQLPHLLRRLAAQTARILNVTTAAGEAGIDRATATDYLKLLEAVFLVLRVPAWGRTLRARVAGAPKLHVVDSGVAAHLLRLSAEQLARRDPASLSQFGHLLETFVVGELLRQASWTGQATVCGHWRTHDGDEVDLIVERGDGRVLAFEVKAAGHVAGSDARQLRRLRAALGDRFLTGVVLYTGRHALRLDDGVLAMPIDSLWTAA